MALFLSRLRFTWALSRSTLDTPADPTPAGYQAADASASAAALLTDLKREHGSVAHTWVRVAFLTIS